MNDEIVLLAQEVVSDRVNWVKMKFGDVAVQQKKTVDRESTALKKYIKGEHMGSEDLHIRKWGELADEYLGPAFIRKFEKGDILYGSRRTYLRKVAIAHFDGITSNTTFVINANEKVIDKRLLPFVMLSEGFAEHSIKNSKGSVNPYVNWKDLASYEFYLPLIEAQEKVADLLLAMDEMIEGDIEVLAKLNSAFFAKIEEEIHGVKLSGKTIGQIIQELSTKRKVVPLSALGEILKGMGIPKNDVIEKGVPCVRYGELYTRHDSIIRKFYSFIEKDISESSFRLKKNDVLFAGSGETIKEIGKSASFISDLEAYAGSDILIFRPDDMDGAYLGYLMNSKLVRQQLNKYGTGSTVMHIYPSDLKKIMVPKIDLKEQQEVGKKLEMFYKVIFDLRVRIDSSKALQKSLINQIFG